MKTIPDGVLDEITRRLVAEFDPEQVILFGSHAWGAPNDDSDIDLLVIVSGSDEPEIARMVRAHRVLHGLSVSKDVLVKTRARFDFFAQVYASLERQILDSGKVLYERGKTPASAELAHQSAT